MKKLTKSQNRCPYGYPVDNGKPPLDLCQLTCARMVRYVLEHEGDVAAIIAEPVRAVPYLPPPGFWQAVRQACDDYGALLIFDEIPGKGVLTLFPADNEPATYQSPSAIRPGV